MWTHLFLGLLQESDGFFRICSTKQVNINGFMANVCAHSQDKVSLYTFYLTGNVEDDFHEGQRVDSEKGDINIT